jgi:hypothetical protein
VWMHGWARAIENGGLFLGRDDPLTCSGSRLWVKQQAEAGPSVLSDGIMLSWSLKCLGLRYTRHDLLWYD